MPSRVLVRRLTTIATRDRWTSVITVGQILIAARAAHNPKLMQDVIRLVAAVKVAPFDLTAAQTFAKLRATVPGESETDDVMIAAIALANDFTLVTRRIHTFQRFPHLRAEDWTA